MKKTLEDLRKDIDKIDEEIVNALTKRMEIVRAVGELKKELNLPPLDKNRWQKVLKRITQKATEQDLSEDLVKDIYEIIHKTALKIEKEYE